MICFKGLVLEITQDRSKLVFDICILSYFFDMIFDISSRLLHTTVSTRHSFITHASVCEFEVLQFIGSMLICWNTKDASFVPNILHPS